ncbi:hypothetical protein BXT86_02890 [candidate division WOR-3 bacterium 4484_100]|uniref:Uncharacterized protein n=1 Tax=candidate division WOR-3 bacterium 4484_100 TaxID=1936077 RepID=A0A1V4QFH5_UNCW3|nr:MAG: hypothetical protein BXT86_02890 [candidate division WOR-3 bacterium 4484_100]
MKKVSKNFIFLFTGDIIVRIIGFIATVYIARILDIAGFGLISYGLAFLNYALLFGNPGVTTIGAREIAKEEKFQDVIAKVLGVRFFLSLIIFLLLGVGLLIVPGGILTKRIIFFYALCIFPASLLLEFVFQGREDMEYIGIGRVIQYGVYLALLFLFVKKGQDILMVPISFLVGYSVIAVFLIFIFLVRYGPIRFSFRDWRLLLSMAIPVGLATVLNQVSLNLPVIILGIFHSKSEVGAFSAGLKIIMVLLIIERVLYFIFFPIVARQYRHSPEKLHQSFTFILRIIFSLTVPILVGGLVLGPRMIVAIYGQGFVQAVNIFSIMLFYFFLSPLNTIFGYGLVAFDKEKRFLRVIVISSAVNFLLLFILGIYYRASGTAFALVVGEIVGVSLMYYEIKKFVRVSIFGPIVRPVIVAGLMSIILYLLYELNLIFLIVLGIFIYGAVFYFFGGITRNQLEVFKKSLQ